MGLELTAELSQAAGILIGIATAQRPGGCPTSWLPERLELVLLTGEHGQATDSGRLVTLLRVRISPAHYVHFGAAVSCLLGEFA